jgi:hypothetical protein
MPYSVPRRTRVAVLVARQRELAALVERHELAVRELGDPSGRGPGQVLMSAARELDESRARLALVRRELRRLSARPRPRRPAGT